MSRSALWMSLIPFFLSRFHLAPRCTLFPYTTLFRSNDRIQIGLAIVEQGKQPARTAVASSRALRCGYRKFQTLGQLDRKSTRLNSSHLGISYAVFCLIKKTM